MAKSKSQQRREKVMEEAKEKEVNNTEESVETTPEETTEEVGQSEETPETSEQDEAPEEVEISREEKAQAIKEQLRPVYDEYTKKVSPTTEAISFQLTEKLVDTVMSYDEETEPLRVLDGGSGWSSVVLRALATVVNMEVYTVDTRQEWLDKSKVFLEGRGMDVERMVTDLGELPKGSKFDVVVHDLGRCDEGQRAEFLPEMYKLVAKGGILVLDDLHKPAYKEEVDKFLKKNKAKLVSWEAETTDQYGRFAGIVHKK